MMPPLQRHRAKFAERNSFSYALLGLISYCEQFSAAARRAGPERGVALEIDRAEVEFLLGLLSLRATLARIVGEWKEDGLARATQPETGIEHPPPRALLR
jgi:hypothetical protein